jgi:ribosomal protein S3AE
MKYNVVDKVDFHITARPMYEILENGDNTVDLGSDMSDRYINIRLNNIIKNYNHELEKFDVSSNYYELKACSESDFSRN